MAHIESGGYPESFTVVQNIVKELSPLIVLTYIAAKPEDLPISVPAPLQVEPLKEKFQHDTLHKLFEEMQETGEEKRVTDLGNNWAENVRRYGGAGVSLTQEDDISYSRTHYTISPLGRTSYSLQSVNASTGELFVARFDHSHTGEYSLRVGEGNKTKMNGRLVQADFVSDQPIPTITITNKRPSQIG